MIAIEPRALRTVAAVAALSAGVAAVYAQNEAMIAKRQKTMKAFAVAGRTPFAMFRGDAPFDLAKVRASLWSIKETAAKAKTVFPDDSKTGDTAALPAAFENRADLFARFDKLAADAMSAQSTIKDEATFKAQWPILMSGCTSCHKQYVKPR